MSENSKYWASSVVARGDKDSYISFLEVQIDKVTNMLKLNQGFNERIETLQTQLTSAEEKIVNLTRLLKNQQGLSDKQQQEIQFLKSQLRVHSPAETTFQKNLDEQLSLIERQHKSVQQQIHAIQQDNEETRRKVCRVEDNYSRNVTEVLQKNTNEFSAFEQRITQRVGRAIDQLGEIMQDMAFKQADLQVDIQTLSRPSPCMSETVGISDKENSKILTSDKQLFMSPNQNSFY